MGDSSGLTTGPGNPLLLLSVPTCAKVGIMYHTFTTEGQALHKALYVHSYSQSGQEPPEVGNRNLLADEKRRLGGLSNCFTHG